MRRFLAFSLFLFFSFQVTAQDNFVVSDIRIEGLQRISPVLVFGALPVSVGDRIDQQDVANIIRNVYATENFETVEVLQEEGVLILRLRELPTISAIEIEGNKMIPSDALRDNMEQAGLAVGQTYKAAIVAAMQMAVEDQYVGQGLYGADVEVEVEEQDRNRVALNIKIYEGDPAKIVHLNIVGNEKFSEEELLELFELRESHFTSFFRKDDRYSREKINGDLERLASFYMDQGYINFDVLSTQVSVNPAKDEVYITINVSEGDVYTVNEVQLAGDLVDLEPLLRLILQVRPGQIFSQQLVTTTSEFISQVLNNRGYFFAEAEGVPQINEDDKTVDVTFFVEPGARTYVNRINFYGNTSSVDEVLRREMRQMEGAPASTVALEQSKVRLERLGFFRDIEYETREVPGTDDQIDVDFSVEEQLSGSIGGSVGYAQIQGLILSADLQQNNFLGTGNRVGIGVNTSRFSTSYNFNFFNPYYTIDGVSRGFSLSYTKSDFARLNLAPFSTNQIAANVTYGYLISETQSLSFRFGLDSTRIDTSQFAVQEILGSPRLLPGVDEYILEPWTPPNAVDPETGLPLPFRPAVTRPISELPESAFDQSEGFIDRNGSNFNNFVVALSWNNSTLNRGLFPTAGSSQNFSLEVAVPGSDLNFWKTRYFAETYIPLFSSHEWVFHARADLGYGGGYGGTGELPFYQNFYAGGLGTVRGYERLTLGPRATQPANYVTQPTDVVRDEQGNVVTDPFGGILTRQGYVLQQQVDENGQPVFNEDGSPVFDQRLARTQPIAGWPIPFGGNIITVGSLELIFPMPFLEDKSQIRSAFFIDGGNVFSSFCNNFQRQQGTCSNFSFDEFRYSAGVAVTWLSGFGPMTFSLSRPINRGPLDRTEVFQFTIGNNF